MSNRQDNDRVVEGIEDAATGKGSVPLSRLSKQSQLLIGLAAILLIYMLYKSSPSIDQNKALLGGFAILVLYLMQQAYSSTSVTLSMTEAQEYLVKHIAYKQANGQLDQGVVRILPEGRARSWDGVLWYYALGFEIRDSNTGASKTYSAGVYASDNKGSGWLMGQLKHCQYEESGWSARNAPDINLVESDRINMGRKLDEYDRQRLR